MAQAHKEQEEKNGLANDPITRVLKKTETYMASSRNELVGYALLAGGIILILHTFGWFHFINYLLTGLGIAAAVYGAYEANLWLRIKQLVNYLYSAFSKK